MKDLQLFEKLVELNIPFHSLLGIKVLELKEGYAKLTIPFRPELIGDSRRPAIHGGVISSLIDVCGGFAVWTRCNFEDRIATIDMRVDYLRPAGPCDLVAESTVRLLGNRVGNAHTIVWSVDCQAEVVAEGRGVYNIRREGGGAGGPVSTG